MAAAVGRRRLAWTGRGVELLEWEGAAGWGGVAAAVGGTRLPVEMRSVVCVCVCVEDNFGPKSRRQMQERCSAVSLCLSSPTNKSRSQGTYLRQWGLHRCSQRHPTTPLGRQRSWLLVEGLLLWHCLGCSSCGCLYQGCWWGEVEALSSECGARGGQGAWRSSTCVV